METLHYQGDIAPNGDLVPCRVIALDKISPKAVAVLRAAEGIEVTDDPGLARIALLRGTTKFKVAEHFAKFPQLMYSVRAGVGMTNFDMKETARAGIATVNAPSASPRAVAQRVIALILAAAGKIVQGTNTMRAGQFLKDDPECEPMDLSEKTLGIIGYGKIGSATATFAQPFFRRVLYTDTDSDPKKSNATREEVLSQSDVISVNISGETELLTPERFEQLIQPHALIVNTARGKVVNGAALVSHMDQGGFAALDVYPQEGKSMFDDETTRHITQHPHFIGTPHTAAADEKTQRELGIEGAGLAVEFAHYGIVNPRNRPGHTLPRVSLQNKPSEDGGDNGGGNGSSEEQPRTRFVLTHPSVPGVLHTVTGIVAEAGENITGLNTTDGNIPTEPRLAMTMFDIPEQQIPKILAIRGKIEEVLHPHRMRVLALENK
ncbi:MAG: NAD(P)-dependent oxidoreductase [Candidatus Peregrinibacteria bacterium]